MLPSPTQLFEKFGPAKFRTPSGTVTPSTTSLPGVALAPHLPVVSCAVAGTTYFCKIARFVAETPGAVANAV